MMFIGEIFSIFILAVAAIETAIGIIYIIIIL
jgi:NADH:ubiquinone oxidoreductase subunit K